MSLEEEKLMENPKITAQKTFPFQMNWIFFWYWGVLGIEFRVSFGRYKNRFFNITVIAIIPMNKTSGENCGLLISNQKKF